MKSKAGITSCIINKRPSVASATMSEEVRFSLLEKSVSAEFQADFTSYPQGLVRGDPGRFVLTQKYADSVDIFRNFPVRSDDVWVVTFPKCGTTWTQEMVWMITHDCDLEAAKEKLQVRSPFIEWPTLPQTDSPVLMDFQKIEAMPSPRVLKSHLPFYLLPPRLADTCKVDQIHSIYLATWRSQSPRSGCRQSRSHFSRIIRKPKQIHSMIIRLC